MLKQNKKLNITTKANIIRTKLLISINKELNSKIVKKDFLINSKSIETYFNEFENYVIVERDIITNSQKDYKRLKEKDELPLYLVKLNLNESSPINLNVAKKMRLTKNPDFFVKKCLSGKGEFNNLEKDKKVEINIRYLRTFCNLLKSNIIITDRKKNRNKSQILRRKKFSRKDCNNCNIELNNLLKKEKEKEKEDKNYKNYNTNDNIIKLHKMWDNDETSNNNNSNSNKRVDNKKNKRNLTLLSVINNNKHYIKNLKLGKV